MSHNENSKENTGAGCICAFSVVMIIKICVQIKKEKIYAARNYKRIRTDHRRRKESFIWRKAAGRMGHLFIKR